MSQKMSMVTSASSVKIKNKFTRPCSFVFSGGKGLVIILKIGNPFVKRGRGVNMDTGLKMGNT